MSSNINPNNINGNFPVAGQDNDSQGFRDNFTNILNNFSFAASEVTDLQNSVNSIRLYVGTNGNISPYYGNVAQDLTVNKKSNLIGDVTASANVTIAGNLIVTGNIYETSTITINQQEIVAGNITTSGNIIANTITTLAGTNGNLTLDPDGSGWITALGNVWVTGNISGVAGLQATAIGNVTPGTAVFTTASATSIQATAIGNVTPGSGAFTTGTFSGNLSAYGISTTIGINVGGNVNANGGNINSTATTANVLNQTTTTINAFGAATTINMGSASGTVNIAGLLAEPLTTKANTATGTAGQICWDANYIYVCTATNTWKRVALTAF